MSSARGPLEESAPEGGFAVAARSVGHLLEEQARASGDRPMFRFVGEEVSFADVEAETNRLAGVLEARGIGKGDRVGVMMPNGVEFPVAWLAIAKAGAVMVPINVQYGVEDLAYVLNDSGAVFVLAGPEQVEALRRVRTRCPSVREVGTMTDRAVEGAVDVRAEMERASSSYEIGDVGPDDLLNIQYTSGTTGFPKGCMLTHGYWLKLGRVAAETLGVRRDDVNLTAQPFYYMDPQWNTVLCMISGIPLVILPRFSASTFWKSVKENGATFFYILGTMPIYLLKQPEDPEVEKGHQVRAVFCSGIVPRLHATYESRWNAPWREAYGMTETGVDLIMPLADTECVGTGAMGKPILGKEVKVVDENGRDAPEREAGEIFVRGEPMMAGYWNKPGATAETIRDGWLHTGDLAYRDEKGFFHLVGRKKDMIRRSAENISAAEVEAVLCEHPAVRAAAVVPIPDELRGEEVKAFIQPQEPADPRYPQELVDFVRERLAAFKAPRFVEYVEEFPMTPSERIAKHKLLEGREDQRAGAYDAAEERWL